MPLPLQIRRIVLTGFMGAGKSTVGALIAQKLRWEFIDADAVIETCAGKAIAAIFAEQGEPAFRALEAKVIRDLVCGENLVLALGGGAIETESTRELLAGLDRGCVVFLDAPLEMLVARCMTQPGAAERPVLADRERLLRRFEARLPHYRSAHLTLATAGLAPEVVATRILEVLENRCARQSAAESIPAR